MRKPFILIAIFFFSIGNSLSLLAQPVLSEREQSSITDEILEERFNTILPALMERTGIDMWIVMSREYNEDPVLKTMLPSTWLSARRTTMLVFSYNTTQKKIDRLAIAR